MTGLATEKYKNILTVLEDEKNILRTPSPPFPKEEWDKVTRTAQQLIKTRHEILKGGAGLAAPQIGINHPVFIYSPNRTLESVEVVINPSFEPLDDEKICGYEACFSVPLHCTKLHRWRKIKVKYLSLEGKEIEAILTDFEAKVFQHEMDHLKGILTIDHLEADIHTFTDSESFTSFMKTVHQEDAKTYKTP
jgi:peptide deformylase